MIVKSKKNHASHYLYSYSDDDLLISYSHGDISKKPLNTYNIYQLSRLSRNFEIYLDLWGYRKDRVKYRTKEGKVISGVFKALNKGQDVPSKFLGASTMVLMHAGAASCMREMQNNIEHFSSFLPIQYKEIVKLMDFNVDSRDELIFHNCKPDIYVWRPCATEQSSEVLVVYLTKNNTLNMPLSLAHHILSKLNISIMYVFNRPEKGVNEFVANHQLLKSVEIIKSIFKDLNLTEVYGLGASIGGYKICQLASLLDMTRVLNFSGNIFHDKSENPIMAPNYDLNKILTILSSADELDRKIGAAYTQHGFNTKIDYINYKSHGTFSTAFLQKKLTDYLKWLING